MTEGRKTVLGFGAIFAAMAALFAWGVRSAQVRNFALPDMSVHPETYVELVDAGADAEPELESLGERMLELSGELGILHGRIPYPPELPLQPGELLILDMGLTLGGDAFIEGEVRDERDQPVSDARVDLDDGNVTLTDRAGHFRFERLAPRSHRGRVRESHYAEASFVAEPSQNVRVILSFGGGIEGDVHDRRFGGAPPGTKVVLIAGEQRIALPLANRRFRASGLPAGPADLEASAPGYVIASRHVVLPRADRAGEITLRDADLELERGGTVSGRVLDDEGEPVTGAIVQCGSSSSRSDGTGGFHMEGVAPGRWSIRAEQGGRAAADEIEVRASDESRIELRLR